MPRGTGNADGPLTEAAVSAGDTALALEWLAAFERVTGKGSGWFGRYLRGVPHLHRKRPVLPPIQPTDNVPISRFTS